MSQLLKCLQADLDRAEEAVACARALLLKARIEENPYRVGDLVEARVLIRGEGRAEWVPAKIAAFRNTYSDINYDVRIKTKTGGWSNVKRVVYPSNVRPLQAGDLSG